MTVSLLMVSGAGMKRVPMDRNEFEAAARAINDARSQRVAIAREAKSPCDLVDMLAFGGMTYCRTHAVMGSCPFAAGERVS